MYQTEGATALAESGVAETMVETDEVVDVDVVDPPVVAAAKAEGVLGVVAVVVVVVVSDKDVPSAEAVVVALKRLACCSPSSLISTVGSVEAR